MPDDVSLEVDAAIYAPPKVHEDPVPEEERRGRPPIFFAVSPVKLVVMSVVTMGFYELFWFYANWVRIKRRGRPRISPFWRTFFAVFVCYELFKTVKETARSNGLRTSLQPGLMAGGWVIFSIMWRLPGVASLLSLLAVLFLVPVQTTINDVNAALAPGHDTNTRFTAWNIVAVVLGGLLVLLGIVVTFVPGAGEPV